MPVSKSQEWLKEEAHLKEIYAKLQEMQIKVEQASHEEDETSRNFVRNLSDDIKMNTNSPIDSFESLIEIEAKNQQLAQLKFKREWLERQKDSIEKLLASPYFAKLDVQYPDEASTESFYIGVAGFSDEQTHEQYIQDWRSPIANLYYENDLGPTSYEAPMGQVEVDLQNRRQIKVEKNDLLQFFDTATAIEDPMLLEVLGEESTAKLQDITSTIQKEQNAIIRDTKSDVLIVEGIAGSGKTSTVLQRIAFLLYRYREDLRAEQVLLLSPNPMFSKYIEEVLPSLGEKNPRQMTYRDLIQYPGSKRHIETLEEQLQTSEYTSSVEAMKQLEAYVSHLTPSDLALRPLVKGDEEVISTQWMREKLATLPEDIAMYRKLDYLREQMSERLRQVIKEEAKKQKWRDKLENLSNEEYNQVFGVNKQGGKEQDLDKVVFQLVSRHYQVLRGKIQHYQWLNLQEHYYLATGNQLRDNISLDLGTEFAYFYYLMLRPTVDRQMKFMIVDEIQDYSEAQLYYLAQVFPKTRFTLVGDRYQAIFAQGVTFPRIAEIFKGDNRNIRQLSLLKSYRSSGPISRFMQQLISQKQGEVEIINRPGKEPEVLGFKDNDAYVTYLKKWLNQQATQERSVILTKDSQEALQVMSQLKEVAGLSAITHSSKMLFDSHLLVMPIYLAKGLEFDNVLVHNASKERFNTEKELNMLYTASSRAMHTLSVPYVGEKSSWL